MEWVKPCEQSHYIYYKSAPFYWDTPTLTGNTYTTSGLSQVTTDHKHS